MDNQAVIVPNNANLALVESDELEVIRIRVRYEGIPLTQDTHRVLEFPKLLWRKIYSIFTNSGTSATSREHTISFEGQIFLKDSQLRDFAHSLKEQMGKWAGYMQPAEPIVYNHTFVIDLIYVAVSTNVLSEMRVNRWVTNDLATAKHTWEQLSSVETIYNPRLLISSSSSSEY